MIAAEHTKVTDWASMYLADEIPLDEFCSAAERWWHVERDGLSPTETTAAKALMEAIAWHSSDGRACIPEGKARDEQAVRAAAVDFLEFMLHGRQTTPATSAAERR